jgi:hypothetical protein
METVREKLTASLRPNKPYLFYGPSQSGKKTIIVKVAKELHLTPTILTIDEANKLGSLPSHCITGRNAFIIRIDSAELVKTLPGTLVFYTCIDPYSFGTADRVNAKFTLVDLTRILKSYPNSGRSIANGTSDTDNMKKPPWTVLQELCNPRNSYDKRLETVSTNPMFCESLLNNFDFLLNDPRVSAITGGLSDLDRSFYIEHSGDHTMLMECMTVIRELKLTGREQLNWRRQGQPIRFMRGKLDPNALYKFSLLGHETGLKKTDVKKRALEVPNTENSVKKVRKAPMCKQCNVLLKGHKCLKKTVL